MLTKKTALLTSAIFALGAGTALAQSTGGSAADPNSNANRQPAPSVGKPSDPATGAKPSAQTPTSPAGTSASSGTSTGDAGSSGAPAGSAADPNSAENRQPAPSTQPSDPAAGSKPTARQPTAPAGTGSSAP